LEVVVGGGGGITSHQAGDQVARCIVALLDFAAIGVGDQAGQVQVVVLDAGDAFVRVGSLVAIGIVGIVDAASRGAAIGFGFGPEAFDFEYLVAGLFIDALEAVGERILVAGYPTGVNDLEHLRQQDNFFYSIA
jgi:hypothetical protein